MVHCTKCKTDGHVTSTCQKPWPFHTEQECDRNRCYKTDHEAQNCKAPIVNYNVCRHCGHAEGHNAKACPIKDKSVKSNRDQYTKINYDAAMESLPSDQTHG